MISSVTAIPARFERPEAYLGSHDVPDTPGPYFRRPHLRAVYSKYFETTFVKITADDGTTGWGECLAPVAPRVSAAIIEDLFVQELIGAEVDDIPAMRLNLYNLMRDRGYFGGFYVDAMTAVDIALWDLKGKTLGQPVHQLLTTQSSSTIPAYVSAIGGVTDGEKAECVAEWLSKGFRHFKHHGGRGLTGDVATMKAILDAADEESIVGLDGHWVYSLEEATRMGKEIADLGAAFFEAPMDPEEIEAHKQLNERLTIAVAVGECLRTRYEYQPWIEHGAVSVVQPDVGRAGISETMAISEMAALRNVPVAPHLSVGLGPMIAASIHVSAAISNLYLLEYQPPTVSLANELLGTGIEVDNGVFSVPDRLGLGVEMSSSKIESLQV